MLKRTDCKAQCPSWPPYQGWAGYSGRKVSSLHCRFSPLILFSLKETEQGRGVEREGQEGRDLGWQRETKEGQLSWTEPYKNSPLCLRNMNMNGTQMTRVYLPSKYISLIKVKKM